MNEVWTQTQQSEMKGDDEKKTSFYWTEQNYKFKQRTTKRLKELLLGKLNTTWSLKTGNKNLENLEMWGEGEKRYPEETHRMTSQGNMGENEGQREAQLHTR